MSRYNKYLESKFHGCAVLAHRDDPGRSRRMMVYGMPEDYTMVGIFDGVDAWVTGANKHELEILAQIKAGQPREIELGQHRQRFATGEYTYGTELAGFNAIYAPVGPRSRRRIGEAPAAQAELPLAAPTPPSGRRRIGTPLAGGMTAAQMLAASAPAKTGRRRVVLP